MRNNIIRWDETLEFPEVETEYARDHFEGRPIRRQMMDAFSGEQ